ncbi:hypothetical protein [Nocardia sp. BMG111209]|uniref:hypothetical protein n=1 Tax=Nocardia sp. BMG111209 TaxID=1160137 RepID=UPI0012DEC96D|nr:hypothetical protein [Nocardia sp. BMG111209]
MSDPLGIPTDASSHHEGDIWWSTDAAGNPVKNTIPPGNGNQTVDQTFIDPAMGLEREFLAGAESSKQFGVGQFDKLLRMDSKIPQGELLKYLPLPRRASIGSPISMPLFRYCPQ